jgi:hypothetical protein
MPGWWRRGRGYGRWSAKLEYRYYDLGTRAVGVLNPLAPPALGVQLVPNYPNNGSIVRIGLNHVRVAVGRVHGARLSWIARLRGR